MAANLACDKFWVNKNMYHDAEKKYFENKSKAANSVQLAEFFPAVRVYSQCGHAAAFTKVTSDGWYKIFLGGVGIDPKLNQETFPKTSLAGEVAKARQHIKSSMECVDQTMNGVSSLSNPRVTVLLEKIESAITNLTKRVEALETKCHFSAPTVAVCPAKPHDPSSAGKSPAKPAKDDDDDVDLFGSESEEEDEQSKKIREQRLAEYAAKKSKKPALVAKSNIILDIKPWDDETDMSEMEKAVRKIDMDGLVWGASKLVPVAFKIFKLQISCVVEDDKVSVDFLTDAIEEIGDYVQSVDIAAFNKV